MLKDMPKRITKPESFENVIIYEIYVSPFLDNLMWFVAAYDKQSDIAVGIIKGEIIKWDKFKLSELEANECQKLLTIKTPISFEEIEKILKKEEK